MLIPSAYQILPSASSCHNGQILFGGVVSQLASGYAQLTRAKALSEAHYSVGASVDNAVGGRRFLGPMEKSGQSTAHFLHQTAPVTSHIGVIIHYQSKDFRSNTSSSISVELRATTGNSYTGTVLDVGVRFSAIDLDGVDQVINVASTGAELVPEPTSASPDLPRPLFVPTVNRGELLNVKIVTDQIELQSVHIYDLFIPEVTP